MGFGKKNRPDGPRGQHPGGPKKPRCKLCGGTGAERYDDIEYNDETGRVEHVTRMGKCRECR